MDRKEACLAQALACRDQAAVDPANHDYWIDEAVKWLERAVESQGALVVTFDANAILPASKEAL